MTSLAPALTFALVLTSTVATALTAAAASATRAGGAAPASALRPGAAAPAFVLQDDAGDELDLHSFAGKPLVMNVFASWCPPCRQELPRIARAARRTAGEVTFVGVDEQEAREIGKAFARAMHVPYRVVYDNGPFAATYGAVSLPVTIFIDAHGRIGSVDRGSMSEADLTRGLASIGAFTARPARK